MLSLSSDSERYIPFRRENATVIQDYAKKVTCEPSLHHLPFLLKRSNCQKKQSQVIHSTDCVQRMFTLLHNSHNDPKSSNILSEFYKIRNFCMWALKSSEYLSYQDSKQYNQSPPQVFLSVCRIITQCHLFVGTCAVLPWEPSRTLPWFWLFHLGENDLWL